MIWLIGGTSESKSIAQFISSHNYSWVATVVTESAKKLYANLPGLVKVGSLNEATLAQFLIDRNIKCIIDASHPFATEISALAMKTGLPYLRFERSNVKIEPPTIVVPDLESVLHPKYLSGRCILLTLGVKALPYFVPWQDRSTIWARILPNPESYQQAIRSGFAPERLISQRLPVKIDRERELWQNLKIDTVITKASGDAGGVAIKQTVAKELEISLIVIDRPYLNYPEQTNNLNEVKKFCDRFSRYNQ